MTNDELEAGFNEALEQWREANPTHRMFSPELRMARYFYFAGSTVGCEAAAAIYRDTFVGTPIVDDDIEGHPA